MLHDVKHSALAVWSTQAWSLADPYGRDQASICDSIRSTILETCRLSRVETESFRSGSRVRQTAVNSDMQNLPTPSRS